MYGSNRYTQSFCYVRKRNSLLNQHSNRFNAFFAKQGSSIFRSFIGLMFNGIIYVLFNSAISKIFRSVVKSIPIYMPNNVPIWPLTEKCFSYKRMHSFAFLRFICISLKKRNTWIVSSRIYLSNKSFAIFEPSKSTVVANLINTFVPNNRFPNFYGVVHEKAL